MCILSLVQSGDRIRRESQRDSSDRWERYDSKRVGGRGTNKKAVALKEIRRRGSWETWAAVRAASGAAARAWASRRRALAWAPRRRRSRPTSTRAASRPSPGTASPRRLPSLSEEIRTCIVLRRSVVHNFTHCAFADFGLWRFQCNW